MKERQTPRFRYWQVVSCPGNLFPPGARFITYHFAGSLYDKTWPIGSRWLSGGMVWEVIAPRRVKCLETGQVLEGRSSYLREVQP